MRIEKTEYGSLGDGKLVKTIHIEFTPEDEEDERIIKEHGKNVYFG